MSILSSGQKKIAFVVNPNASMGKVGKQWPRIRTLAEDRMGPFSEYMTAGPKDAGRLTRDALLEGAELIVCVGGDGTLFEVVNGFMGERGPVQPEAVLGFVPIGTGCDFIKTVPIPKDIEGALDIILAGHTRIIDLGRVEYRDHEGRPARTYFHNVTSFGLGGEVDDRVNRTTKAFGGFISFIWATVISVLLYNKKVVRLRVDDLFDETITTWHTVVANGRYHGGGMWVAPDALMEDGLFHVTIVGDLTLPQVFRHLPKLYNGRLFELEQVRSMTGKRIEATSDQTVLLDVDGEQPGTLPVTVEIVPGALRLLAPE